VPVDDADAHRIELRVRVEWQTADHAFNPHGLSLARNLVSPPRRKPFRNAFFRRDGTEVSRETQTLDLWVVADERLDAGKGYLIVFDEEEDKYGLALEPDEFLGYYGSLADTIAAM
jgi:hypothetical protein